MFSVFGRQIRATLLALLDTSPSVLLTRAISQKKLLEEKKRDRLLLLRNAIHDIYHDNGPLQLDQLTEELHRRNISFSKSNFAFSLLSALDPQLEHESVRLTEELFVSIAKQIGELKSVQSNLIASVRYAVFLGHYPHYLQAQQLQFIRQVAVQCCGDKHQVVPISTDILQALSSSSAANCRLALELLPQFLQKHDLRFKISSLNILLQSLIHFELVEELLQFFQHYHRHLTIKLSVMGQLCRLLANNDRIEVNQLLQFINYFSNISALIPISERDLLLNGILRNKLHYRTVQTTELSKEGLCSHCGQKLEGLSAEEFRLLRSNFRQIIFDKDQEYMMAHLPEFEYQLMDFGEFIGCSEDGPSRQYDLVVDGLNVAYQTSATVVRDSRGLRTYTKVYKVKQIDTQITRVLQQNQLSERFGRILLIGRQHMKKWSLLNRLLKDGHWKNCVDSYFLLDKTADDNFILFAAIQHPHTKILTNDFFRDHLEKFREWFLNQNQDDFDDLGKIFRKWLRTCKITTGRNGLIEMPDQFDVRIQVASLANSSSRPCLHIPVVVEEDPYNEDHRIEWICAQH